MAGLVEVSQWEDEIYQLETTDPVEGGPDGIDNRQAKQLANRTQFLKDKFDVTKNPNPLSQYLAHADWLKHMLFKGMPMSAVGLAPDPNIWLPAGRVELLRADYETVFEIVSASACFTDQATIDADPRAYAGHWGTGDGETTFTTDDWALMMNIKVAGGYGAAGSTKEDHIQNIAGTIWGYTSTSYLSKSFGQADGAFSLQAAGTENDAPVGQNGTTNGGAVRFDASRVARTSDITDTMGLFLDHYRVIPKGVFSYA